jgi:hypothetical protein
LAPAELISMGSAQPALAREPLYNNELAPKAIALVIRNDYQKWLDD